MTMQFRHFLDDAELCALAQHQLDEDMRASRLSPVFQIYYRLRPLIPLGLRHLLQRGRKLVVSDRWCYPDAFFQQMVSCVGQRTERLTTIHPWPEGASFAFVLTHDVEDQEGMRNIAKIAAMEEDLGFRSSWNIVPYKYRIDVGLIRDLQSRSFEIGIHGYNHDGKLYASRRTFARRAVAINQALRQYGAVGFRSPMVHRNLEWLQLLDIEYDASCFDADPYQAMPGGVGSIWPFEIGKFVELPYTLPQDHTLFIARGERDGTTWLRKLEFIARNSGLALMLTHPDYMTSDLYLNIYRDFLIAVRQQRDFWHALPREVVAWWQTRRRSVLALANDGAPGANERLDQRGRRAIIGVEDEHLVFQAVSSISAAPAAALTDPLAYRSLRKELKL
jgi:peptidoglycan/xylan/chitin deacetylase (PgdA/CDA1 family)